MTLRFNRPRARRKWLGLVGVAGVALAFAVGAALAVHDVGEFELDKDATNDISYAPVGYLNSNINASVTSIDVCRTGGPVAVDDVILIRAERMEIDSVAEGNFGGNCPGTKETYGVTRGFDGTTANSQSGGANNIGARVSKIVTATLSTGPDWDQVYASITADDNNVGDDDKCIALGLVECTFVEDGIGPTTFTQGSTKDHLPIAGWFHTSGASPDKGEILNAYAAKAVDENDDEIIYFGMDRYAVDGSTDIGFWFFQDLIVACPDPDAPEGACDGVPDGEFAGEHIANDLLILGTFTQGGAASDIRVFKWVESGGNEQEHIQGPTGAYGDCVPGSDNDEGCATVNNTTIEVPWTYTFKGASVGKWVPAGGFFEGGVNLTAAGLEGCFSSFLAETRSSPEVTAILKDFALGDFEACDTELTTTPSNAMSPPAALTDSNSNSIPDIEIGTGSAGVDVTDKALLDVKGTSTWAGTLSFYLCGPIASPDLCEADAGVLISTHSVSDADGTMTYYSDPANLTEVGRYCWRGEFDSSTEGVPDAEDATSGECFEVLPVTPALSTQAIQPPLSAPVSGPVPFGDPVYDKATLVGTANEPGDNGPGDTNGDYTSINATNGAPADGTITFTLKADAGESCGATAGGTGSNPEDVDVAGDGDYFTSGFTPNAPGDYAWVAVYSGSTSGNTLGQSHNTDCTDGDENVTVQQLQPTMSTAQSFVPNDAATITVASGAGDLAGSVVFELFVDNATCTGTADYTSSSIDITSGSGTGLSRTVTSNNTTAYNVSGTTFHWVVTYTSTNTAHKNVTSGCGNEHSSITIDNGVTQPSS